MSSFGKSQQRQTAYTHLSTLFITSSFRVVMNLPRALSLAFFSSSKICILRLYRSQRESPLYVEPRKRMGATDRAMMWILRIFTTSAQEKLFALMQLRTEYSAVESNALICLIVRISRNPKYVGELQVRRRSSKKITPLSRRPPFRGTEAANLPKMDGRFPGCGISGRGDSGPHGSASCQ